MKIGKFIGLLFAMIISGHHLSAQFNSEFGQNRIQYKSFDWVSYSTNHFDVYHYDGGKEYAEQAISFLEDEFNNITDLLGYAPYSKTKIFIYNSIHDLQQSNIGLEGPEFDMGGQTNFIKLQIEIAHPGFAVQFRQELVYKLSRILIEEMLFGGSLAEVFQSSYLLNLPTWFIDGAARYLAFGWSSDMDDYVRNYLEQKRLKKLIKIKGEEAGLIGQSVWNFIALNYGKSNVSNILNLTRIIRNEENSISSTLGLTHKQFLMEWQNYYTEIQKEISNDYESPPRDQAVVEAKNSQFKFKNVRISKDGNKVAYSQNDLGRYKIYVHDYTSGQTKKIESGGTRVKGQKVDYDLPLLDWVDTETIGLVYFKSGYLYLSTINTATGERLDKPLTRFNKVESFSFNENGRLAIISGEIDGKSDIYLVSMRRNATRRITNDIYDDEDPVFVPGTAAIIFSSNRPADTLDIVDQNIEDLSSNFNLFLYDLDTTIHSYTRLTNTFSRDFRPKAKSPYEVYFLSDQRGVTNIFRYDFMDSTYSQVTNFDRSVQDFDVFFDEGKLIYLMLDEGVGKIFMDSTIDLTRSRFSPQTARQRFLQAQFVAELYNKRQLRSANTSKPEPMEEKMDEDITLSDTISALFPQSQATKSDSSDAVSPGLDPDAFSFGGIKPTRSNDEVDTDNYRFSESTNSNQFRPESFFTNYQRLEVTNNVVGPLEYAPQFSFSNLTTSFAIDPIRGFGAVTEAEINDVLGNYRLSGGGLIMTDLNDADLYAQFSYLKHRLDFKVRAERSTFFYENNDEDVLRQRYTLNKLTLGASLPLSNWFRIEFNPFYARTGFENYQFNTIIDRGDVENAPDRAVTFLGFESRAVFDNTLDRGYNIIQGTKGLLELKHHQAVTSSDFSFTNLVADFRHYQRIHRELTLATRFFYGTSFGPDPQNFMIGGVPNWLFNETRTHTTGDPLEIANNINDSGVLFGEFVQNLRGFDLNERFGSSSLVFNAELRFPVFQYLSRAPISSTFLRNFSLISFFDFGSAWTGPIPLTRNSSTNTIVYRPQTSVFSAEISNFRNPWLASYGFGLRTVLLGYFIKIDYSRPIEEFKVQDRRLLLSVGLDF